MEKNNLGLPIEYQVAPEYFDLHNVDATTDPKNEVVARILQKHNANTVLDMTCGTGAQVLYLHKKGFNVTGSDFSPALLDIARQKAETQNIRIPFVDGDMRTVQLGHFDAVITIANAIGHLTKTEFAQTLKNIHSQLNDNGIYVFDILNLNTLSDAVIRDFTMHRFEKREAVQIHTIQYSTINRKKGLVTSYDTWVTQTNTAKPVITKSSFSLQVYTPGELQSLLKKCGFTVIAQMGLDGTPLDEHSTISMMIVAQKN